MFDVFSLQSIINVLTHVICYVITVTTTGSIKARVAHAVGDDTAYRAGLTSWDPLVHIDWLGLVILLVAGIGWGRGIPVNQFNIYPPHRTWKLFVAHFSRVISNFIFGFLGLFILVLIHGDAFSLIIAPLLETGEFASFTMLNHYFESSSHLTVMVTFLLLYFVFLNLFLAIMNLIVEGVDLGLYLLSDRQPDYFDLYFYHRFFITIILFFFLLNPLLQAVIIWAIGITNLLTTLV